ncbi:MAG TPA: LegC family aminotransferase [Anaerovoracaceae bacterium]|nr:LegC family aminotransferase [Anaerovoracaceae bacterium]
MRKEIPLSTPNLNMNIVENLKECIETGWVSTGGRYISEFEKKTADYLKVESAVSTQCGTAGLHLALKEAGVNAGDEVIVPTLTFIAAVNPVIYCGAHPIFMDCDDSLCMDMEKLDRFLHEECERDSEENLINKESGRAIKAIVPVHIFGNMADMEHLMDLAAKFGLKVVEDATEALGSYVTEGRYKGKHLGTIGDIGVYSFNANKIITTGGGGMIVSGNKDYLEHIRYMSLTAKNDSLFFVHDEVGYNYRMLNIQAALGVSQIDELEDFIQVKTKNYNLYRELLADVEGITLLPFKDGVRTNYWFYSLLVDKSKFGMDRDELMNQMIDNGIQCRPIWKLIHTQKCYLQYQFYKTEKAEFYEKNILNVPCSTNLSEDDVKFVCESIRNFGS